MSNVRKHTPAGAARFIGRVGALAVALGIGAAVANTPGAALADTGDMGGGTSSAAKSSSQGAGQSGGKAHAGKTLSSQTKTSSDSGSQGTSGQDQNQVDKYKQAKDFGLSKLVGSVTTAVSRHQQPVVDDAASTSVRSHGVGGGQTLGQSTPKSKLSAIAVETKKSNSVGRLVGVAASSTPAPPTVVAAVQQPAEASVAQPVATVSTQKAASAPASATFAGVVNDVLSVLGLAANPRANSVGDPVAPLHNAALWTMFGFSRREVGQSAAAVTTAATSTASVTQQQPAATSVLITADQLAAEQQADAIVQTLPMQLMKQILMWGFQASANQQFSQVGGVNQQNLDQLSEAVDEYAQQAAMEYQLLDPMNPTVLQMVMPPHSWAGQTVTGTRILYDNPDTIYRMMAVNSTSSYVITGKFTPGEIPAETTFSVLTGLGGTTTVVLNSKDMQINPDGSFSITVSSAPAAAGATNHLQLPTNATLIVARNTLSDWDSQQPMSLSIERVSGPSDSLFAQIGGFDIPGLGPLVSGNTFLTNLVSLIPPLPTMPTFLQGTEAAIVMALGLQMEPEYIAVATQDGAGNQKAPNVFTSPQSNATFLATQLQSAGYFQLTDQQALVLTINPGSAGYFVVPVTNDWTITNNYWDQQTSLNISQAIANPDGTYTIVVSPTDPGVANWVSTGGLNQGTISIRFQDIDTSQTDLPTVSSQVVSIDDLGSVLPVGTTYVTAAQREAAIDQRKAGYDNRFTPYPQI
ncbi:hypothetical protein [Mycobacterium sp. OTB74]|uniref:hypothetical protein n=1 Tax=Mycobacterium sp. OTB74 TaxID=1853452 RepID=UPI002473B537|nr:hypothetical protein [Mycobacterium sp. OTB74]MDH6245142.1 hypothetical protein [Mycobacterium sp. OTB74]